MNTLKLYEIENAITELVDLETGEILDVEAFEALSMERDSMIEGMACWYKNLAAEVNAIKEEENALAARRKSCEKAAARLKEHLTHFLGGANFKTARVSLSWRSSEAVEFVDETAFIEAMAAAGRTEFLKFSAPEVSRKAVKEAIEAGEILEGASIVKRNNIQIR